MSIYEQDYGEDPEHLEKNMVAAAQGWISRLESKAGFLADHRQHSHPY
jgi:hypothetical protein